MRTRPSQRDDQPAAAVVREQLARILSSDVFARSDRLSAFLQFIVERTLNGEGDSLKEQVLAVELYGKDFEFNTAADPIVRVDARRLRDKLREYYASTPNQPVVISVPKGSYIPAFELLGTAAPLVAGALAHSDTTRSEPESSVRSWRWPRPWIGIALILLLGAGSAIFFFARSVRSGSAPLRFITVTAFPGYEGQAAISPDGQRVVFGRTGPDVSGPKDLWIRDVEGDAIKQLTDTPDQDEIGAVWSPGGREIAFMSLDAENPGSKPGIFVMSVLDGQKRKVAEGGLPAWTPDGRSLVMTDRLPNGAQGMFQHILATGERRQLTWPAAEFTEAYPTVSPDGSMLAFARAYRRTRKVAVFVTPMSGGEPQRKTDWHDPVGGLAWTPDGRELLYSSEDESGPRTYRISASGSEPGRLVRDLPITASTVTASRARSDGTFRLSFVHGFADVGLRLIDMQPSGVNGTVAAARFCDSARIDTPGRFSRDGTHVAFASTRSGRPQLWVASRDESGLRSVTTMVAASINVGSWSNDGRAIAFDAVVNGNADIYVVGIEGGAPQQLTHAVSSESDPEWSADGRWIYFVSDASGRSEIWRVPAGGGQATRITSSGGFEPRETSDGRTLYYMDQVRRLEGLSRTATLKQVPAAGGEEQVVLSGVTPGTWDITDRGIIFLEATSPSARSADALAFYDFADRRVHKLGPLGFTLARFKTPRIAVSRDGRWVLANHLDGWERDVMVVDSFR